VTKLVTFTDIHFGKHQNSDRYNKQALEIVRKVIEVAKENNIKYGVFCGDWFNDRINIKSNTLDYSSLAFHEINRYFKSVGGMFYVLTGNHDLYYRNSRSTTGLRFLEEYEAVHLIDKPEDASINGKVVSLFPWLTDEDDLAKVITDAKGEYLFCHGEFRNFKWNANSTMLTKGLPVEAFSKFKKVFSGHYHLKQSGDNVTYLGSPQQQDFGDFGCERGWYIVDIDSGDLTFIENDVSSRFYVIKLSELSGYIHLIENNHIKIVEDVETHSDEFDKIYSLIMGKAPASLSFESMKKKEEEIEVSDEEIESLESLLMTLIDGERAEERKSILKEMI